MIIYTGKSATCSKCGVQTTFANQETGLPQHPACLGLLVRPAALETPRPASTPELSENLEAIAALQVVRIQALAEKCQGDLEKMGKQSIPMVMDLFEDTRMGGRLPIIYKPPYPDLFKRATQRAAHQVWLAKHNWSVPAPDGPVEHLDVPAAYLNAFKCWLPVQPLRHDTSKVWSKRMAGVYRITPPEWTIPDLPNPLGDREEAGDLWVTSATMNLLMWCADDKRKLCDKPIIHEAWTAHGSEDLLTGLRSVLAYLRSQAIRSGDNVTRETVKDMYAKFYATIGDSPFNHRMKRPEWNAIIHGQAAANVWGRAYKLRAGGCQLVHVGATDEIHVVGDWRKVFTEGEELTQMKIKKDD